ncbi:type II toxin-antitoxin system RelB family antitoxin [Fastidiosipila sanguinis]|uniref:Relaxosome protein TraY n=1 Tax=Fastidiosipila sanguinis TaxID=236753 RepID=A0A2S0KL89_9FIRM|nr:DUF6290 family protein [Fastidiosipila sanguinis]AVM41803.1 hypothetical protein C5Q98_00525 [Fastidiosipila sanguinis]
MLTSIRLNEETSNRLDKLSKHNGKSKAFYLRQLIEDGLGKLEYEYEILQDIEDYRKGKTKTYTLEEMENYSALTD